ncbi:MAG: SDR family NAD(P)-dependent oxidoreductase [Cellulomonadaceae bacterium]|nr:SDR family NAD(P)-dependent oxidoreductase [Cellulomonadaceae bacterium]
MTENRVVAITGASNGMGLEAATLFAARGWRVFAGARRVERIPQDNGIVALPLDVTDSASNSAFVEAILAATDGRIDVIINNAGYGEFGPAEEIPMAEVRRQFETNFFGAVELTQLVLPAMRKAAAGRIVNVSSIGGDIYMPLGAYYHATKAALQQWSDVLDVEVSSFGVRSVIVQPGGTESAWGEIAMANAEKNLREGSPYGPLVAKVKAALARQASSSSATSADLAQVFFRAATDPKPKSRYFNALGDRAVVKLARTTPGLLRVALSRILKV